MKSFIRVMKALSDANRVRIIKALEVREICVCELTALLGLAQSTVSKHLKILEDAELVESSRDGSWINYRLAADGANSYACVLRDQLKEWLNDDPEIQKILKQVPKVDRVKISAL